MSKSWISVSLGFLFIGCGLVVAQQKTEPALNAREIFYKATPKPAAPATPAKTAPAQQKTAPPAPKAEARKTEAPAATATPVAATAGIQTVAYSPLGVRYSLLRRAA